MSDFITRIELDCLSIGALQFYYSVCDQICLSMHLNICEVTPSFAVQRQGLDSSQGQMLACPQPLPLDRRSKPHPNMLLKCPRCESLDTKFCYYNNYSLTQPRYFCKNCKRYWTSGGALRNVPVGGGLRKNKRSKQKAGGHVDAAKTGSSAVDDTANDANSHGVSINGSSLTADATNLGYSDSSVSGNYSFDKARMENQRGYEAGDEASRNSTLPHFGYGEELRNAVRFYPGYGYRYTQAEEGLPQHEAASYGFNLLDQRKSGRGQMPEALEEKTSFSNQRSEQHHYQAIRQPLNLLEPEEEEDDEDVESQGYAKARKLLPASNELELAGKSASKFGNQDAACDEANGGVVNPYDWQQISEGLFPGNMGDFFYLPGGNWPDWSHFDSGNG